MLLITDYYTPAELSGYARAALADISANRPSLARWLPNRTVPDLAFRFTRGGEGLTEAATYRSWDTESPISSRPGVTRVSGELPPISRKMRQDEYTRLRTRANGDGQLRGLILSDAERLVRQIAMRVELARGESLQTGQVTMNENGVIATVDFGRRGDFTTAPGTLWSNLASATVLADYMAWVDAYESENGVRPGSALTSNKVLSLMLQNQAIREMASSLAGTPQMVSRAQLNQVLEAWDLPPVTTYNAQVKVAGTARRIINENAFILLPAPVDPTDEEGTDLGATLWGTPAEALEPEYEMAEEEQGGIVVGNYKTPNPVALWTNASAVTLPVMANPNLSMTAMVAA